MEKNKLENTVELGQGSRRNPEIRASRNTRKGGRDECGHQASYKKVPKSVVISELGEISVENWQREWNQTTKEERKE